MRTMPLLIAALQASSACKSEPETTAPPSSCAAPNRLVGDRCLEPGVQDDGCPAGTLGQEGTCQPAGILPELCAAGFEPDGKMGCEPVLPPERCPVGHMALPGESACRPVMPCGSTSWGDIPVDGATIYVDGSYTGLDSDGSAARPWTTISNAVAAAPAGALVAIATGSYAEDVVVQNKPVRLWGRCPDEVEIIGTGASPAALLVREGGSGSEVRGLAISGAALGLAISGAEDVSIESVWAHDAFGPGILAERTLGPTSVVLRSSLVERNRDLGVLVMGVEATLEDLHIRTTQARSADQELGRGLEIDLYCDDQGCDPNARATASLRTSIVEDNLDHGVYVGGSDVTVEGVVVRGTLPRASDARFGRGMVIGVGCYAEGLCNPETRGAARVRSSLLESNHEIGLFVSGSDATLEGVAVRDTLPRASDGQGGIGIASQPTCTDTECLTATRPAILVRSAVVERNRQIGTSIAGSDATLEALIVRDTLPRSDQQYGMGILMRRCAQPPCDPSIGTLRGSIVESNRVAGVAISASDAALEGVLVRATLAGESDGLFGDGVLVTGDAVLPTSVSIAGTHIDANARAGIANFGAFVSLGSTALSCNKIDVEGEVHEGEPFTFENLGTNACGCPHPTGDCLAQSAGFGPPAPITESFE